MSEKSATSILQTVNDIGFDALELQDSLVSKAENDSDIDDEERAQLAELIERADAALDAARAQAREKLENQIAVLERQIRSIEAGLSAANLPDEVREELETKARSLRGKLAYDRTVVATDFAGILPRDQLEQIDRVLDTAREDVRQKKKAAAFLGTLIQVADLAFDIVRETGGLI